MLWYSLLLWFDLLVAAASHVSTKNIVQLVRMVLVVFKREQYWKTTFKGVKTEAKTKTSYSILFFSLGAPVKRNKLYSCTPQGKGRSLLIVLQGKGRSLLIVLQRKGSYFQTVEATSMTNLLPLPPTSMTKVLPFPCKTMSKHVPFFLLIYDQRIQYFLQHSQYF